MCLTFPTTPMRCMLSSTFDLQESRMFNCWNSHQGELLNTWYVDWPHVSSRKCLSPAPALAKWQSTKMEVVKMFDPKHGGSYEVFNKTPLTQILVDYCIGDVRYLPVLSRIYEVRLSKHWSEKVRVETGKRLQESRRAGYKHKGKLKMFGPRVWIFPPNCGAKTATTTISATLYSSPCFRASVPG